MKPGAKPIPVSAVSVVTGGVALRRGQDEEVKTPAGAPFVVPTQLLAEAIAAEFNQQGAKVNPATMPFAQLAMTAIDVAGKERITIIDAIILYASTELLCHHAEHPPELAARQTKVWQPLLDWCAERFHAPFVIAEGLMPMKQPKTSIAALQSVIEAYDAFYLAGLRQAVDVSGSLVLGLALAEGHIDADKAFEAAELDTSFQMEKWGEDPAHTARRSAILHELKVCERWFSLLKPPYA
jgi:chaperone required for assembly of F1-ATPase